MRQVVQVHPGICGFTARIVATSDDGQHVSIQLESECPSMQQLASQLEEEQPLDALDALDPHQEIPVLAQARELLSTRGCCRACVVPVAVCKAMQVVTQLALPDDVSITFERETDST